MVFLTTDSVHFHFEYNFCFLLIYNNLCFHCQQRTFYYILIIHQCLVLVVTFFPEFKWIFPNHWLMEKTFANFGTWKQTEMWFLNESTICTVNSIGKRQAPRAHNYIKISKSANIGLRLSYIECETLVQLVQPWYTSERRSLGTKPKYKYMYFQ